MLAVSGPLEKTIRTIARDRGISAHELLCVMIKEQLDKQIDKEKKKFDAASLVCVNIDESAVERK